MSKNGDIHLTAALASLLLLFSFPVSAEIPDFSPPHWDMVDQNGIELNSGSAEFTIRPVAIGPANDRFELYETYENALNSPRKGLLGEAVAGSLRIYGSGAIIIQVLGKSEAFKQNSDGTYSSWSGEGGLLVVPTPNTLRYIDRDDVIYDFSPPAEGTLAKCVNSATIQNGTLVEYETPDGYCGGLVKVTYPSGRSMTISSGTDAATGHPFKWTVRSDGLAFREESAPVVQPNPIVAPGANFRPSKAVAVNLATDYCDLTQLSCSFSYSWPTADYQWSPEINSISGTQTLTFTDSGRQVWVYTIGVGVGINGLTYTAVSFVRPPTSVSENAYSYSYYSTYSCVPNYSDSTYTCENLRQPLVNNVFTNGVNWAYSYEQLQPGAPPMDASYGLWRSTATRPDNFTMAANYNIVTGYIQNFTGTKGTLTYSNNWQTSEPNRLVSSSDAEGRTFNYTYDGRGNMLTKTQVSTKADVPLVIQANYDTVCTNQVTCNKPNWIKDANLNQTDYTYDPVHGGVLTETGPAVNGVRPQKRYTYVQRYPWLKNAAGSYSRGPNPIWVPNTLSYCRTSNVGASGTGCTASNDEVVTTYDYGPDAGPNNLFLRGQAVSADGAIHRTCYRYDALGNKVSETTANAALASCP